MIKRVLSLLLCLCFAFSSVVFANENVSAIGEGKLPKEYVLSLDDAIKMALEENPQFISIDTRIADAKVQIEDAKRDMRNSKGKIMLPEQISVVALRKGYFVKQAEITLKSTEMEKEKAKSQLSYDVTNGYYNVKYCEQITKNLKKTLEIVEENKKTLNKQFELGMVSELDVKNAGISYDETLNMYNQSVRALAVATESFKIKLRIEEPDCRLILTDDIEYSEFETDFEVDVQKAMENRADIYSLKSNYEQSLVYRDAMALLGVSSPEYSSANSSVVQCEYYFTNTKKQIKLLLKSAYNDIITAKENLEVAQKKLSLENLRYDVAKLKYELGMITNTELTSAMLDASSAQTNLEKCKLSYKLAAKKYGYEITIGL